MEKTLSFGVVGCGHIGKKHIKVLIQEPDAELSAICDIDTEVLENQEVPDTTKLYQNFNEMLEDTDLDIVTICTPHNLHAKMAIQTAKKGKHIIVEKPMSLRHDKAEDMIRIAEEHDVRLFVVKQNRYNKPILMVKKALDEGKLGKVFMIQCNVFWNRNEAYYANSKWRGSIDTEGGALHTQVSHFIDLMVWWVGSIKEASTVKKTMKHSIEIEDCGVSVIEFESGTIGSLNWSTAVYNYNYEGSITLIGEKGTIKVGGKYLNEIAYWDVQSYPLPEDIEFDDVANNYGTYYGSASNHDKFLQNVISSVFEKRKGVVEGMEGIKTIAAIEKIYNSDLKQKI